MAACLVVCTTCRASADAPLDAGGRAGGQALLGEVLLAAASTEPGNVRVEGQACLWACSSFCTVYLSEPGKPAYLAGRFSPTSEAGRDILAFARLYAASENGAVAYRDWPEGMKGHFIARLPADR